MQAKFAIIRPFTQPMECAPFLCKIVFIIADKRGGVKNSGISTLGIRVLIVYTQFMNFRAGGVY